MRFGYYRKPAALVLGAAVGTAMVLGKEHNEHVELQPYVEVPTTLTQTISVSTATVTHYQTFAINDWD